MSIIKCCTYIYEKFLSCDYLGPGPELLHNGNANYQTFLGALLSCFALIISIISIIDPLSDVIYKTNPSQSFVKYLNEDNPKINNENFKLFFRLKRVNQKTRSITVISLPADPKMSFLFFGLTQEDASGVKNLPFQDANNKTIIRTGMVSCQETKTLENYNNYMYFKGNKTEPEEIDALKKESYCLPEYLNFEISQNPNKNFQIIVNPAIAKVLGLTSLDIMFIEINHLTIEYNPNDFDLPYKQVWVKRLHSFQIHKLIKGMLEIKNSEVEKSQDMVFTAIGHTQNSYTIIDQLHIQYMIDLAPQQMGKASNVILTFGKSPYKDKLTFDYMSISQVFANFGGTFDFIGLIIGKILVTIVTPFFTAALLNSTFQYHINDISPENVTKILETYKEITKSTLNEGNDKNINLQDMSTNTQKGMSQFNKNKNLTAQKPNQLTEQETKFNNLVGTDENLIAATKPNVNANLYAQGKVKGNAEIQMPEMKLREIEEKPMHSPRSSEYQKLQNFPNKQLDFKEFCQNFKNYKAQKKEVEVTGCLMYKVLYCNCCCENSGQEKVMLNSIDFFEKNSQIEEIIKNFRELKLLKYLLLNSLQRGVYDLPSINANDDVNTNKFLYNEDEEEAQEAEPNENEKENEEENKIEKRHLDFLGNLDVNNRVSVKMVKVHVMSNI